MPSLESGSRSTPWRDSGSQSNAASTPWRDGVELRMVNAPFVPPPPPPGGTPTSPSFNPIYLLDAANSYEVVHVVTATDLRDGSVVPFKTIAISTDEGSVCWALNATGEASLFARFSRANNADPPVVSVMIDGIEFRFIVERVQRTRRFGDIVVSVSGRSMTIAAGEPYQLPQNWINQGPTSAAQLIDQAQFYTGMRLTWLLADWVIPDRLWSFTGTPLAVAKRVAESVGAIVRSDRAEFAITVMPRYESMPNEWGYITPDVSIHVAAFMADSYERSDQPLYNGVYVSGQQQGVIGFVFLQGTQGESLAPLVTDLLLTDAIAVTQRGTAILGASGPQARVTLTLPVLTGVGQPGVLDLGMICRIVGDEPEPWHGVVRAVSVSVSLPSVQQTVVLERHTGFATGTVILTPVRSITLVAPIPPTGSSGVQSGEFTVVGTNLTSNVVVTPASTLAGTFSPASVTLNAVDQTRVFRLTPTVAGVHTVSVTNNGSIANPPPVAYTASAAPAIYILDTFTGTGNLLTHLPEIGGAYQAQSGSGTLDALILDGAGRVYKETGGGNAVSVALLAPPTLPGSAAYYVEIEGYRNGSSVSAGCGMRAWNNTTDLYGIQFRIYADGTVEVSLRSLLVSSQLFFDVGPMSVGPFLLRVSVTNLGRGLEFLFNGVAFYSVTVADMPALALFGIEASQITPRMIVSNFVCGV